MSLCVCTCVYIYVRNYIYTLLDTCNMIFSKMRSTPNLCGTESSTGPRCRLRQRPNLEVRGLTGFGSHGMGVFQIAASLLLLSSQEAS